MLNLTHQLAAIETVAVETVAVAHPDAIACIRSYLARRVPVPHWQDERPLYVRLPLAERLNVSRLQAALHSIQSQIRSPRVSVTAAIKNTHALHPGLPPVKTLRAKFDLWSRQGDWLVLVNRSRAGDPWQITRRGLSNAFLDYVAARMGQYKRADAGQQAILSIHRQWHTGRTPSGLAEPIPGYETDWDRRQTARLPVGWHPGNIRKQLQARAKFTAATKALLHHGIAAARDHLPQVHSTRANLRFLEQVQFDDVRCDFRVIDTVRGQICDLWLLIARDVATGLLLGFGLRPALARDDGSQEHLKLQDMKQLCGWLLETYGLPPWQMTWKIENGTATLADAVATSLVEMLGADRIKISYSSMIAGQSPARYAERATGNSKGKAMLESLNRLQHMMTSHFPGQIGLNYSALPAEHRAREKEALNIWTTHREEVRDQLLYPFYTVPQARQALAQMFALQNTRTTHDMEGFRQIAEWFDGEHWQSAASAPGQMDGRPARVRMESPAERAAWLLRESPPFARVSPDILVAWYAHNQRQCTIEDSGEIKFQLEGKTLRFTPPAKEFSLPPGSKVLAYFCPDDPKYVTLTDGRGAVLGAWARRALVDPGDRAALADAIRHSQHALKEAKSRATELATTEISELAAMRRHNEDFETLVLGRQTPEAIGSPIADAVRLTRSQQTAATSRETDQTRARETARQALGI